MKVFGVTYEEGRKNEKKWKVFNFTINSGIRCGGHILDDCCSCAGGYKNSLGAGGINYAAGSIVYDNWPHGIYIIIQLHYQYK